MEDGRTYQAHRFQQMTLNSFPAGYGARIIAGNQHRVALPVGEKWTVVGHGRRWTVADTRREE